MADKSMDEHYTCSNCGHDMHSHAKGEWWSCEAPSCRCQGFASISTMKKLMIIDSKEIEQLPRSFKRFSSLET